MEYTRNTTQLPFLQDGVSFQHGEWLGGINRGTLRTVLAIVSIVYAPFIVLSSSLIIASTCLVKKFHTAEDYIFVNLAAADLIVAVVQIPISVVALFPGTMHLIRSGKITCSIWHFSISIGSCSSLTFLFLLCVERSVAINMPFRYYQLVTKKVLIGAISFSWMLNWGRGAFSMTILSFNSTILPLERRCDFYLNFPLWYVKYIVMATVTIKLVLSAVLCVQIVIVAFRHARNINRCSIPRSIAQRKRARKHAISVKITVALMFLFILLWSPRIVVLVSDVIGYDNETVHKFNSIAWLILLTNSFVNAPVYAFCRPLYRDIYRQLLVTPPSRWGNLHRKMASVSDGGTTIGSIGLMPTRLSPTSSQRKDSECSHKPASPTVQVDSQVRFEFEPSSSSASSKKI
ncbi:blue-sensitive opsin [Aplysia californica]|uniref:Blue-sensitive opsin n=1 Tax=Aplysia californica TaxID=6500 RepID=A0ABM0K1G2_APLCA|nr:blue-sensitive opsin [Aplysia californica]